MSAASSEVYIETEHLEDGYSRDEYNRLIYKDPTSGREYMLNEAGTEWIDVQGYEFDGNTYSHTDSVSGKKYKWNLETNSWDSLSAASLETDLKQDTENSKQILTEASSESEKPVTDENTLQNTDKYKENHSIDSSTGAHLYYDKNDEVTYEWDPIKNIWFPRIDEDFIAKYQMNYGFTPDGKAEPTRPSSEVKTVDVSEPKEAVKKSSTSNTWFNVAPDKNNKVYVSNLPNDMNLESFVELMSKCGVLDIDVRSNKPKAKLYYSPDGTFKGDGLCTYMKIESVKLALKIIDGSLVGGNIVKVELARFEMRGAVYDPKLKPKKLRKKELEKLKQRQEKALAWAPSQPRSERVKHEKVVIIKNLLSKPLETSELADFSDSIKQHCERFGIVKRAIVHDRHPEKVVQVFYSSPEEADVAISMMDGRLFDNGRVMSVKVWDGKTKYRKEESAQEEAERLEEWSKFLTE